MENEDVKSLLIKAVENNIDKFEQEEDNRDLCYNGLTMSCGVHLYDDTITFRLKEHYFDLEIKYKNFKTRLADASLYEKALNSLIDREKLKEKHLQEKDLKELRELCK